MNTVFNSCKNYIHLCIYLSTCIHLYMYIYTHTQMKHEHIYLCMHVHIHVPYVIYRQGLQVCDTLFSWAFSLKIHLNVYPLLAHKNRWTSKSWVHNFLLQKKILQKSPPKKHRETLIGTTALGDHSQITKWEISKVFKKREDGHATYTKERKQHKKQTRRHIKKKEQNNDRQKGEKIIRDKTEL